MASSGPETGGATNSHDPPTSAGQAAAGGAGHAAYNMPGYGAYGGYGAYNSGYYGGYGLGGGHLNSWYGPSAYYGGLGSGLYGGYAALASRFAGGAVGDGQSSAAQAMGVLQSVMAPGQSAMATLQNVMHAIARVTGILEENMRNIHILFDSVFGLVYNLTFLRDELRGVLQNFRPKFWFTQWLRRLLGVWRLLLLLALTPFSLRLPPVAALLRLLGLVPRELPAVNEESDSESVPDTDDDSEDECASSRSAPSLSTNERQSL
ncbi:hypothetical protein CCYA_CCYA10G2887 [Cyanidiococcus yangmingshanensis]|nr:hypothetical protein CCYA_CCYA10G2887 [Cyanidiococcus yangmingshanensis]